MKDYLNIATCFDDTIRIYSATTTNTVKEAQDIHNLWPTSCAALGRTLTLGLMMSVMQKAGERLTIKINGNGPIGQILVEASYAKVRGFVHNPGIYLTNNNGKLAVGYAVGTDGLFEVTKDLHLKAPFSSSVELVSGEIAEDAAEYFLKSEQTPTAVSLGVLFDREGKVTSAGGYIIQVMPNCTDETITFLEKKLSTILPISSLIEKNNSPEEIINLITEGNYKLLDTVELSYSCDCSKERFERGIKSLGESEIKEMISEDKDFEVNCNFCNKKYTFTKADLEKLI